MRRTGDARFKAGPFQEIAVLARHSQKAVLNDEQGTKIIWVLDFPKIPRWHEIARLTKEMTKTSEAASFHRFPLPKALGKRAARKPKGWLGINAMHAAPDPQ